MTPTQSARAAADITATLVLPALVSARRVHRAAAGQLRLPLDDPEALFNVSFE